MTSTVGGNRLRAGENDNKKGSRRKRSTSRERERYFFIGLGSRITDASPGCRFGSRGRVTVGEMNPGVPYKRPIV